MPSQLPGCASSQLTCSYSKSQTVLTHKHHPLPALHKTRKASCHLLCLCPPSSAWQAECLNKPLFLLAKPFCGFTHRALAYRLQDASLICKEFHQYLRGIALKSVDFLTIWQFNNILVPQYDHGRIFPSSFAFFNCFLRCFIIFTIVVFVFFNRNIPRFSFCSFSLSLL